MGGGPEAPNTSMTSAEYRQKYGAEMNEAYEMSKKGGYVGSAFSEKYISLNAGLNSILEKERQAADQKAQYDATIAKLDQQIAILSEPEPTQLTIDPQKTELDRTKKLTSLRQGFASTIKTSAKGVTSNPSLLTPQVAGGLKTKLGM